VFLVPKIMQTKTKKGRVEEARAFFESAVKEAEKGFGPEDEHLAASYQNLAELLRINGEFGGAEELYLKAINMLELKSQKRASPSSGRESKVNWRVVGILLCFCFSSPYRTP